MAEDAAEPVVPIDTTPIRAFEDHEESVLAVAVSPDRRRMVTSGKTLRLWDLESCVVLKNMEGHGSRVWAVAVSPDGQLIASGDVNGEIIIWNGETGELVTQAIKAHSTYVRSLDFSRDGKILATASWDDTAKLYNTETWQQQGDPIECSDYINCVHYSPSSSNLLAIATRWDIKILDTNTRKNTANFEAPSAISRADNFSLAWTPDGTRLLSSGSRDDPTIREWSSSTWKEVGDPWKGHTGHINAIAVNPAGTLVASASDDNHVRLWRLEDRRTIAIFKHPGQVYCVTFSADGKRVLSGGDDKKISEWTVPKDALPEETAEQVATNENNAGNKPNSPDDRVLHMEIPGQEDDHTEYRENFFRGMSYPPEPRRGQRMELLKRLFAVVRTHRSAPSPTPPMSSTSPPITLRARLQHLLPRRPDHAGNGVPLVVNVSPAWGKPRHAAGDAPSNDNDLVAEEYYDPNPPTSVNPREHESRRLCFCLCC